MIDVPSLEAFQAWALKRGQIDAALPIDQLWDPQFIERAAELLGR
jgi:hypothetical protein